MKKIFTILSVSLALVVFANSANAQSSTTISTSKEATATDLKSAQTKEVKTSTNTATKTAVTEAAKKQGLLDQIKQYETKIEANRNNPKFDLKAAEEELARLKQDAGVK